MVGVTKDRSKEQQNELHTHWLFRASALATEKGVTMAYPCVLAPSHECDGCQECEEKRPDPIWDRDYDEDEEYCRYVEREGERYDS